MDTDCSHISYFETGFFSKLTTDYIAQSHSVKPFYEHEVSVEGIKNAIKNRKGFSTDRKLLQHALTEQYNGVTLDVKALNNLSILEKENTFTVTTAHQPNIFTGPLYFIYKILHAIKLSQTLSEAIPDANFVPVYYMGSEDADLEELNHITIDGTKYTWQTIQTGAVGRMKTDKALINLIDSIYGQIGVLPHGKEFVDILKKHYKEGVTIQHATLTLVNELFGEYGLLVVIPDNALLKKSFQNIISKELKEGFSHKAVSETLLALSQHYKVQAGGRELNLFYLTEDKRERIERDGEGFVIKKLQLKFSEAQMMEELQQHPERFSANVILRGVFQETILPNVAFIGGGGELAYWLELKDVFKNSQVPYPVLVLRNSFLFAEKRWIDKAAKLNFSIAQLFASEQDLSNSIVKHKNDTQLSFTGELEQLKGLYNSVQNVAANADITLKKHVASLQLKAEKGIEALEKKMLRAGKRKYEAEIRQLKTVKSALFPKGNLQEREENIAGLYARYGKEIIALLLHNSLGLEQQFSILSEK